jgi:hypothetical protein
MLRYFPATGHADIYVWIRAAVTDAGLEPARCALVTVDSAEWRDETTTDGGRVRVLRKRGVILSDEGRAISFTVITGGGGRWDLRDDRISEPRELDQRDRAALEERMTEARDLLHGKVYFPAALFSIAYPPRDGDLPWGAILRGDTTGGVERTAFRRDGAVETSPFPGISVSDVGGWYRLPQWIEDPYSFAAEQAKREKPRAQLRCPCCGYLTLMERAAHEICHVCWWEDDGQDDPHADERWGGPNGSLTLAEARENFRRLGAVEERLVVHARPPMPDEL